MLGTIRNMVSWCLAKAPTDADSLLLTSSRKEEPLEGGAETRAARPLVSMPGKHSGRLMGPVQQVHVAAPILYSNLTLQPQSFTFLIAFGKRLKPSLPEGHFCIPEPLCLKLTSILHKKTNPVICTVLHNMPKRSLTISKVEHNAFIYKL